MNKRILVIDDNRAIHADFLKILTDQCGNGNLNRMENSLFNEFSPVSTQPRFEVDCADQGRAALRRGPEA